MAAATVTAALGLLRRRELSAAHHLLRSEALALEQLHAVHARAVDRVVAQAAVDPRGDDAERAKRAAAHVRWAMPGMLAAFAGAIETSRRAARDAALADLSTHVHEDALDAGGRGPQDAARAYAAAAGLVSAWGASALLQIGRWSPTSRRPLAAELADTAKLLEPRLRRTAATENAHAFVGARSAVMAAHADVREFGAGPGTRALLGERREASAARARALSLPVPEPGASRGGGYRDAPPLPEPITRLVKVWSAKLDAKVCDYCYGMNGTVVDARDPFPDGDPPVHPFCRCVPVLLETRAPANDIRRAMRAATEEDLAAARAPTPAPSPANDTGPRRLTLVPSPQTAAERALDKAVAAVNRVGVENAVFLRDAESMRDMTQIRGAYLGAQSAEINAIARGELPAKNSGKLLAPLKITFDDGEVHLEDGRHRLAAALEAGAAQIRAVVSTYVRGEKVRREAIVNLRKAR